MRGVDVVWCALVLLVAVFQSIFAKECTNIPTELSSHTFQYQLFTSSNETWKEEVLSQRQGHLIHTDEETWASLLPRKVLRQQDDQYNWDMLYRKMKNPKGLKLPTGVLKEVSLHNVRLDQESIHGRAQQTNLEYLLMLDVDNLVWSFRKNAGLPTPGTAYGGWEKPDVELRGHFVGHYLSATAHMWASTHNDSIKTKMDAVVTALAECQEKLESGYLSAFPEEYFDLFEAIKPVWAPYYTIHKIMAGLLDQYVLAGNTQALKMVSAMADYFFKRVQNVIAKYSIQRHWTSLNEETGGMNDVLYKLYTKTGDKKHLILAHLFDKPCFLGPLALQADELSGFHSNTHIPIVIGTQSRYEVVGDPLYKDIGIYFMDIVNASHSYVTGGTSDSEFWHDPKRLADTLGTENEESCTTYNMLKVSRTLFKWTKEMAYADYYERALTNGVLGIQRGEDPGVMIYMLPLGHGVSKARTGHGWGTQYDSFWCCYGTGIESFSKMGDSIYFEEEGDAPGLYVMQYISSSLQWKCGLSINMKVDLVTSYDPYLNVTLTLSSKGDACESSALNLRIPSWVSGDAKASYNSETLDVPPPGNFLKITKKWNSGDTLKLGLPMAPRLEAIKDDRPEFSSTQAILFGPYVLAGLTDNDWVIKTGSGSISDWLKPIPPSYNSHLISLAQASKSTKFALAKNGSMITMQKLPHHGTNESVHATFRLIVPGQSPSNLLSHTEALGEPVMLEPFDHPGTLVVHHGREKSLRTAGAESAGEASIFRIVPGLDGGDGTVSLESDTHRGCYVYSSFKASSGDGSFEGVKLKCGSGSVGRDFKRATSFAMQRGVSQYHPISFTANGATRNYLMQPLQSLKDEYYNVYFDIQP
uniref:Uncharacterized protein n=1 Tax=Kalanchoe fedtschenkoi TaxID=63787 RepID=A0A7N0THG0_KALFE